MSNAATPRPKRPPSPRSRLRAPKRQAGSTTTTTTTTSKTAKRSRRAAESPEALQARTAFDGTQHASIRARRIYEGGIEHAEGLGEFIDGYPLTVNKRSARAFLTRLYNGASEYLGWCLDTGRLPRVHTLPPQDSFK